MPFLNRAVDVQQSLWTCFQHNLRSLIDIIYTVSGCIKLKDYYFNVISTRNCQVCVWPLKIYKSSLTPCICNSHIFGLWEKPDLKERLFGSAGIQTRELLVVRRQHWATEPKTVGLFLSCARQTNSSILLWEVLHIIKKNFFLYPFRSSQTQPELLRN